MTIQCKCNDSNRPVPVTGLGCAKGGILDCPRLMNQQCKNGDRVDQDYLKGHLANYKETRCVCRDGVMPK